MEYKKILTIQDISCVGQCSLTVALPIISACGIETCILPSAVLSTHTAGFTGYTVRDLSEDIPAITDHWEKENIRFAGIYTGYLGSTKQIDYVIDIMNRLSDEGCVKIVDPAMADNGSLYPAFDMEYASAMKKLSAKADYLVPNLTEACLLADIPYTESYDEKFIDNLTAKLLQSGCGCVVLTGIGFKEGKTGIIVADREKTEYYEHERLPKSSHGTGDVYASAFTGALIRGRSAYDSAKIAADYTVECIKNTMDDDSHWYGVKFEPLLGRLAAMIG